MGADMEAVATAAGEATQPPEARPGRTGGTADLVEVSAAAASDTSNTIPEHRMAAVITVRTNTEGTARAGRDINTGRTAAAAAVAADMGADTPPATEAEWAEEAAGAAGTERPARLFVVKQTAITLCRHY